jgi:hypothetical protein
MKYKHMISQIARIQIFLKEVAVLFKILIENKNKY